MRFLEIVCASRIPPRPLEAQRLEARCLRSPGKILGEFCRLWAGSWGFWEDAGGVVQGSWGVMEGY